MNTLPKRVLTRLLYQTMAAHLATARDFRQITDWHRRLFCFNLQPHPTPDNPHMSQYWTDLVRRLTPYVPGAQRAGDDVVKLNTNENPYPPSPQVSDAIARVQPDSLRRYPDPQSLQLRTSLAEYHQLEVDQVFVGNGSDEILALAFMTFFQGKPALHFPEISYSFYPVYCDLLGITPEKVPLNPDYTIGLDKFSGNQNAAVNCGGIIFPNPNAPTGIAITLAQIERILEANADVVVLIDEAYADFGAESAISLVNRYPNLVVSRTFSKGRSLAGLRLGAAFADKALIEGLTRTKDSFNSYPVDAVAQAAGIASLNDEQYYRKTIDKICNTREATVKKLTSLGYRILPSQANFIFASPGSNKRSATEIFKSLDEQNILVRHWDKKDLKDWLRITIGTEEEMQKLFDALQRNKQTQ